MVKLEQATRTEAKTWLASNAAAVACFCVGVINLVIGAVYVMSGDTLFDELPDLRAVLPLFGAAIALAAVSVIRRERNIGLVVGGIALAAASLALGWVLALVAVAAVTLIVIHVLTEVM
jgi:ABC-type sulfate transport system permease component